MSFYRRNLPHWQPREGIYFVTSNLVGSLPKDAIEDMRSYRDELRKDSNENLSDLEEQINRKIFEKYEHILDNGEEGPTWLANESVADLVEEALHYRDENQYDLYAYCIMSNHFHVVFKLLNKKQNDDLQLSEFPVTELMKNFKSYTAVHANQILDRNGQFWHRESFDRVIRNAEELENKIAYTLNNPVKAGLVGDWEEWPHSYCKPAFISTFKTN